MKRRFGANHVIKFAVVSLSAAVTCSLASCSSSEGVVYNSGAEWKLVWEEEFDGEAGQAPNPEVWFPETGGGGWGNEELQYYTNRTDNAQLNGNGALEIRALREDFENRNYTSARLITSGRLEMKYGRVEARIKLPIGQGVWPAFWMLGGNFDEVGWPQCGEIDILELRGQEPDIIHGSVHGPGYSGGGALTNDIFAKEGTDFTQDFHTYAIQWDPGRISWSVDGEIYHVVHSGFVPTGGEWVFDQPFFLLLNVAIGGNFLGNPTDDTPFPAVMEVDWIRIYERQ